MYNIHIYTGVNTSRQVYIVVVISYNIAVSPNQ